MFNQTIDAIQTGKKTIVNTFVTDKEIQSKLVTLIAVSYTHLTLPTKRIV